MIWCAEIGSMHNGDKSLAYELIRQTKNSGATIAKFQLGWTKEAQLKYAGNYDKRRYIDDWAQDLKDWCDRFDIEFMASIWSMEGLEVARSVNMKRYKIAHQMDDGELIGAMSRDGKQIIESSTGFDQIGPANGQVFTTSEYPTLRVTMPNKLMFGYSSHAHGIGDALIAVARGAKYIEKHFTLDKTGDWPRDRSFALLPDEFEQMVKVGNEMAALL